MANSYYLYDSDNKKAKAYHANGTDTLYFTVE
jgi:hypothetical protein